MTTSTLRLLSVSALATVAMASQLALAQVSVGDLRDGSGTSVTTGTGNCVQSGDTNAKNKCPGAQPAPVKAAAPAPLPPAKSAAPPPPPEPKAMAEKAPVTEAKPVAPPPPPPPPPPPAPEPAAEKPAAPAEDANHMSLQADALFAFRKADLTKQGKAALAAKVKSMGAVDTIESVDVTGHADRIGSTKSNQTLSDRRARTVKKFLVAHGIPADRINATGKGETEPVTGDKCPKTGKESAANKKLVKCLAPDRRVDIVIHRKG